ncbi:hypothetical protein PIB30_051941 [Stylosanthes scabra]|uniref:Cyclin N-terminal domain-containing protein n=1 Tax=Stylosanthes scabra TaxID=79078 RepID=A0ABU6VHK4_9FABA|nr:hypothetical protein [Stylosanthes scabra]
MSHRKSTAHKSANNPSDDSPLSLSQLPLRKWFNSKEILKSYLDVFSKLPVLKPRYLSEGLLLEDKYEVDYRLLTLGVEANLLSSVHVVTLWLYLVFDTIDRKLLYYPRLMRVVATSLWLADKLNDAGEGEFYLTFWIGGVAYTITLEELASLWGLPNDGIRFKGGHLRHK